MAEQIPLNVGVSFPGGHVGRPEVSTADSKALSKVGSLGAAAYGVAFKYL